MAVMSIGFAMIEGRAHGQQHPQHRKGDELPDSGIDFDGADISCPHGRLEDVGGGGGVGLGREAGVVFSARADLEPHIVRPPESAAAGIRNLVTLGPAY